MTSKGRRRWLVPAVAVLVSSAALLFFTAARTGLFHRFEADGVKINPRAPLRPDVTYELVVWEEAVPAPWAQTTQQQALEAAIQEFMELYPNVHVHYELLDAVTARNRLSAAVKEGRPPDVYGAARATSWPLPYQVPATPYMPTPTSGDASPYSAIVNSSLTVDGSVWGWPRAFWWEGWLARKDALVRAGIVQGGNGSRTQDTSDFVMRWEAWNYDTIAEAAQRSASDGGLVIALDVSGLMLLEQLVSAAPSNVHASEDVTAPWDAQTLAQAARFVRALHSSQRMERDPEAASRSRFAALSETRADVVAPVNVYGAQSALRRDQEELIALPPPAPSASAPVLPVAASAYFVFRQHDYKGDDHTRAAAELAAFLAAQTEMWLVEAVGLLPVSDAGWSVWRETSPWNGPTRTVLERASLNASPVYSLSPETTSRLHEALRPHWQSFLAGDTTPEQFSERALEEAERVLAAGQ